MRGPWNAVSGIKRLSGNPPITLLLDSLPASLRESGLISSACVCVTIPGKPGNPCTLVTASKRALSQACRYLKTCQNCCEPVSKYLELQSSLSASLMQAGAAVMLVTGMRSNSHRHSGVARMLKLPGHRDFTQRIEAYSDDDSARSVEKNFSPSFFSYREGLSWHFCASHCKQSLLSKVSRLAWSRTQQ